MTDDTEIKWTVSQFIYASCDTLSEHLSKPLMETIEKIIEVPLDYVLSVVDDGEIEYCYPRHIPQYSDINSAIEVEVNYLAKNGVCSLEKIGSVMPKQVTDNISAKVKYGENHSKLLEIFGLALVQNGSVQLTEVGVCFSQLDTDQRLEYIKRSIFRAPIIRNIIIKSKRQTVSVKEELSLFLSDSTAKRRLANVCNLIKMLETKDQPVLTNRLRNINRQ